MITRIKKHIKDMLSNLIILTLIILLILILSRYNTNFKNTIHYYLYEDNISFMSIKRFYNKYLGGVFFTGDNYKTSTYSVFDSKLSYQDVEKYKDGVKLLVSDNYLVPSLKSGIVIFIGKKDNYGDTIIIQGIDGIEIWYGNISNSAFHLYDYVEEGKYLGEANDDYFYLVYSKENRILDYKKYLNL